MFRIPVLWSTVLLLACGARTSTQPTTTSQSATPTLGTTGSGGSVVGCGELVIGHLEATDPMADLFDRCVSAFGVKTYGAPNVADDDLMHAAIVTAEWLDNDEDGLADDAAVVASLVDEGAFNVIFQSEQDFENSPFLNASASDGPWQPTWVSEMNPTGPPFFDATVEEVLHLINVFGHAMTYTDRLAFWTDSDLTAAMDLARGGHFTSVPQQYPEEAWYHYDDATCDYGCMAVEYLYWSITTRAGMQADSTRCEWISDEWEPCTSAALEQTDVAIWALLTDAELGLPSNAPDGVYAP